MSKYNSILDSIHAKMDKFIEDGLLDNSAKVLDVQGALRNLAGAMLDQMSAADKAAIEASNAGADGVIADQVGILLDTLETVVAANNPLTALTVDVAVGADTDLLGKVIGDLQDNVEIESRKVTGDIIYVDDYTGFSGLKEEQSGYYLVLHASVPNQTGVTIKAEISTTVTLDADGILIVRLKNKKKNPITFIAEKSGYGPVRKTYDISGLNLLPPETEGE